jgi:cyclopropane fatty-acyl-phospholipid synthase-like methyltransferase
LFDYVMSIEAVKAVGLENMDAYYVVIDCVLKGKNTAGRRTCHC